MPHLPSHRPARSRARHLAAPALVATVALAAACAEIGTDPDAVVSIEFNRLPSPAILVGDTLRTLEGEPALVRDSVRLFDQATDTIKDATVRSGIRFVATIDTARIAWDSTGGYIVSTAATGLRTVGIQAQAGGLFPPPVSLAIVPLPPTRIDTVRSDTTTLLIEFNENTGALSQSTKEFTVRLRATDSLVTGWPIEFSAPVMPSTLESVRFIGQRGDTLPTSRLAPWDTTQGGLASRYILARLKPGVGVGTVDTVVVQARFRVRRDLVDSVRLKVPIRVVE